MDPDLNCKMFKAAEDNKKDELASLLEALQASEPNCVLDKLRDNSPERVFSKNNNLLYTAARTNALDVVRYLLQEKQASVNMDRKAPHNLYNRSTALHVATFRTHIDTCILLRRYGADVRARNEPGDTPLDDARECGNTVLQGSFMYKALVAIRPEKVVNEFLQYEDDDKVPPLVRACQSQKWDPFNASEIKSMCDSLEGVRNFIKASTVEWTPLHYACATGNTQVIDALSGSAAFEFMCDSADRDGWLPVHVLLGRISVVPHETAALKEYVLMTGKGRWNARVRSDLGPLRHDITRRMWQGRLMDEHGHQREYILYVDPSNLRTSDDESFPGLLFMGSAHLFVTVTFFPKDYRRIRIIDSDGHDVLDRPYYHSDHADVLAPLPEDAAQTCTMVYGPDQDQVFYPVTDTLLAASSRELRHLWWSIHEAGSAAADKPTYAISFVGNYQVMGVRERYDVLYVDQRELLDSPEEVSVNTREGVVEVVREGTTKIRLRDAKKAEETLAECDYDHFRGVEMITDHGYPENYAKRPHEMTVGLTPLCWLVEHHWHDLLRDALTNLGRPTLQHKLGIMSSWLNSRQQSDRFSKSMVEEQREKSLSLLRSGGALLDLATDNITAEYVNELPNFNFSFLFDGDGLTTKRNFERMNITDSDQATSFSMSSTDPVCVHRRNCLLAFFLKACAQGDATVVERYIDVLRHFKDWSNGDLINTGLPYRMNQTEKFAVSVATKYNRRRILQVLVAQNANVNVGGGEALRYAIRSKSYNLASWIINNGWKGKFVNFPSQVDDEDTNVVDQDELEFCYRNGLVASAAYEKYLTNCTRWKYSSISSETLSGSEHTALVVLGMKSVDFGTGMDRDAAAPHVADVCEFMESMAHRGARIIVLHLVEKIGDKADDLHPVFKNALMKCPYVTELREELERGGSDEHSAFFSKKGTPTSLIEQTGEATDFTTLLNEHVINELQIVGFHLPQHRDRFIYLAADGLSLNFNVSIVKDLCIDAEDVIVCEEKDLMIRGAKISYKKDAESDAQAAGETRVAHFHRIQTLVGYNTIRYNRVFEQFIHARKVLTHLTHINFGFQHPRAGELFLYLSLLMTRHKAVDQEIPSLEAFSIQGLHFEVMTSEYVQSDNGDIVPLDPLATPLHYLMMLSRHGMNTSERTNAQDLLVMAISFMNRAMSKMQNYTFPGGVTLLKLARGTPPPPCTRPPGCRCIYHYNDTSSGGSAEEELLNFDIWCITSNTTQHVHNVDRVRRPRCVMDGASHLYEKFDQHIVNDKVGEVKHLVHVLNTTPLVLAIRLRLSNAVRAMICDPKNPPLLNADRISGRDPQGRHYQYDEYKDLWGALSEDKSNQGVPPFHIAAVNCCVQRLFGPPDHPNAMMNTVKGVMSLQYPPDDEVRGYSTVFPPGRCIKEVDPIGDIAEDENGGDDVNDADDNTDVVLASRPGSVDYSPSKRRQSSFVVEYGTERAARWRISAGHQWLCPDCGVYVYECYHCDTPVFRCLRGEDNDRDAHDRAESFKICQYFVQACCMYKRFVKVSDNSLSVLVQRGGRSFYITPYLDFIGLFKEHPAYGEFHRGESGISLVLKFVPELFGTVRQILMNCPISDYHQLNDMVVHSPNTITVVRRQLWKATKGGVQFLALDSNLTLLQWAALLGDVKLCEWVGKLSGYSLTRELEESRSRIGFSALHYAAYSGSSEVLQYLVGKGIGSLVDSGAWPRTAALTPNVQAFLAQRYIEDPTQDPHNIIKLNPVIADEAITDRVQYFEDNPVDTTGETALHIACGFAHKDCAEVLINEGRAMVRSKNEADNFDSHDVALCLLHKFDSQLTQQELQATTLADRQSSDRVNREREKQRLDEFVRMLNEGKEIQGKFARFGIKRFILSEYGVYMLFVICLTLYAFLFNVASTIEVRPDYLAIHSIRATVEAPLADITSSTEAIGWFEEVYYPNFLAPVDGNRTVHRNELNSSYAVLGDRFLLVGDVRLAQLRVTPERCTGREQFSGEFLQDIECSRAWNPRRRETDDYNVTIPGNENSTIYKYDNWDPYYRVFHSWYTERLYRPGEGYFMDFSRLESRQEQNERQIAELPYFIDRFTRSLLVQTNLYSLDLDIFIVMDVWIEFSSAGGVFASTEYTPVRLDPYNQTVDMLKLLMHYLLWVFWVWLLSRYISKAYYDSVAFKREWRKAHMKWHVNEFRKTNRQRPSIYLTAIRTGCIPDTNWRDNIWKMRYHQMYMEIVVRSLWRHLMREWTLVDLVVLANLLVNFVYDAFLAMEVLRIRDGRDVFDPHKGFIETFSYLGYSWRNKNNALSMVVLFSWIAVLRCLSYIPYMGPVATAVVSLLGTIEVFTFFIIVIIVTMGFIIASMMSFGYRLEDYRSFHQSSFRIMRQIIGEQDITAMEQTHFYTGSFLVSFLIAFVTIVLMNTFIAVLNAAYESKLEDALGNWLRRMTYTYQVKHLKLPSTIQYKGSIVMYGLARMLTRFKRCELYWKSHVLFQEEVLQLYTPDTLPPHLMTWRFALPGPNTSGLLPSTQLLSEGHGATSSSEAAQQQQQQQQRRIDSRDQD
eukprot:PhM_4_TR17443/c0_g1_i1/m.26973